MTERLYATLGVGMEQVVSRELGALGIRVVRIEPGRARFEGTLDDVYRAVIHSRCASRIVRELAFEQIEVEQDLYEAVRAVEWERWMTPDSTFRVHFNVHSSLLRNTRFGLYRIKDAVCDRMLDRTGKRPSVATEAPDLYLTCYLENRRLSIGLDAAGEPLHMRGYRVAQHETSLREHLAAAMVLMSGWEPSHPLHDPFCGSGTILIEAAMIATNTPPSHYRKRYGCMGWRDFDRGRFDDLRQEAEAAIRPIHRLRISGADRDERAVRMARDNLRSSGFDATVEVQTRDVCELDVDEGAFIITNPPYGVRVGDEASLRATWQCFRERVLGCPGVRVVAIAAEGGFEKAFGLRPYKRNRLNNGPIRCVLAQYEIHT